MNETPSNPGHWTVGAVSRLKAVDDELVARLVFRVGGHALAHEPERVGELIRHPAVHRVPNAPGVLAGLLNSRGRVVPVYDIRGLLPADAEAESAGPIEWVLVFHDHEPGGDDADDCVGVVIDDMPLRLRLAPTRRTASDELPELFRPWCRRTHERERALYGEIDMIGMMESIRGGAASPVHGESGHAVPDREPGSANHTIANLPAADASAPSAASGRAGETEGNWGNE